MERFFDKELDKFRSDLSIMGAKAIEQVRKVTEALVEHDVELAQKVRDADNEVDELEKQIDAEAIRYMTLRNPVASELRLVVVGMKASHDLERVADEATNIAKRIPRIAEEKPLKDYIDLPRMSEIAIEMLDDALEALFSNDLEKAKAVLLRDKEVDRLDKQLYRELSGFMLENPKVTTVALELMFISRSLERIADHAGNIAEEVIFLIHGKDVRHTPVKKILKED
ncbi:MAG: phosphate signaling complex protein PhoU [Opitutales bacterium]|nr:phosphate signaling complex protein PhoU [Opitutales bacterium]